MEGGNIMSFLKKLMTSAENRLKIIIVGAGKIGSTLADRLTSEGHDITVVDHNQDVIDKITNMYDVMGIVGNGSSYGTLIEAGIETADLIIAVTDSDELNLLCCALSKKVGDCSSIARVRNPDYSNELSYLRDKLEISMIINPELEAAREITRILHFPSAISVNSFAKGSVDMIKFKIPAESALHGMTLIDFQKNFGSDLLICVVERNGDLSIPNGSFRLISGDIISFVSTPKNAYAFFKKIKLDNRKINSAMIIGGGKTAYYLADRLIPSGIRVKIIESDQERCEELSSLLSERAIIVNGNGTDESLLMQENLEQIGALIPLTGLDEKNILLTLYAMRVAPETKVITKVNHINFTNVINELELGSVVYPRYIVAEMIVAYVRAKRNSIGSNIETLYHLFDNKVEAIEFKIAPGAKFTGIPLKNMTLKDNLLIACINRSGKAFIPGGDDCFNENDTVIIVTTHSGFNTIDDIFDK